MWLAGVSSLAAAEKRAGKELWEWWLDALHFKSDSAGRLHIIQILQQPALQSKLRSLFDGLDIHGKGILDAAAIVRFSVGVRGTVRVLLHRDSMVRHSRPRHQPQPSVIKIPVSTPAEHDFLVKHFDVLFPPEHPLDLPAFLSLAKLVLVRRIVKALVKHHGLHRVQQGMRRGGCSHVHVIPPTHANSKGPSDPKEPFKISGV